MPHDEREGQKCERADHYQLQARRLRYGSGRGRNDDRLRQIAAHIGWVAKQSLHPDFRRPARVGRRQEVQLYN